MNNDSIAVTVVSGFLGAGKTTCSTASHSSRNMAGWR